MHFRWRGYSLALATEPGHTVISAHEITLVRSRSTPRAISELSRDCHRVRPVVALRSQRRVMRMHPRR